MSMDFPTPLKHPGRLSSNPLAVEDSLSESEEYWREIKIGFPDHEVTDNQHGGTIHRSRHFPRVPQQLSTGTIKSAILRAVTKSLIRAKLIV
jgi:hypothetical protein